MQKERGVTVIGHHETGGTSLIMKLKWRKLISGIKTWGLSM